MTLMRASEFLTKFISYSSSLANDVNARYYRRAYVDDKRKIFCITCVALGLEGYSELLGDCSDFDELRKTLVTDGYQEATRSAFLAVVRQQ